MQSLVQMVVKDDIVDIVALHGIQQALGCVNGMGFTPDLDF